MHLFQDRFFISRIVGQLEKVSWGTEAGKIMQLLN